MTHYEKKEKVRKQLTNGSHFIRTNLSMPPEIKLYCTCCGKTFWVELTTAVDEIARYNGAECSPCGTQTLQAY
jgi:DNA-directed RNA polymerase subunit RPC12/RpoP